MSEVRRWAHTVVWEGLQISATYMAINDGGEYVMHDDYAALEADRDRLKVIADNYYALLADANAELAKLRAGQEPVLYVNGEHLALALDNPDKEGRSASASTVKGHYCDTPLYTTPQPSAVPDGWREALQQIAKSAPPVNCAAKTETQRLGLVALHALIAFSAPQFQQPMPHKTAGETAMNGQESAAPAPAGCVPVTDAARDVLAERQRQVSAEGWTPEHDDEHGDGSMALAASCYACASAGFDDAARDWPWSDDWFKPSSPRRDLIKAGALILAEIERLDRAAAPSAEGGE